MFLARTKDITRTSKALFTLKPDMVLCSFCRYIPLEDPPSLPPPYLNITGQPYDFERSYLFCVESSDPNSDEVCGLPPYGYPHWSYLYELASQARTCDLCRLIHEEFLRITNHVPHADELNFFITSRNNNQQGFLVWTKGDRPGVIWRVGAFSCCVDNCMFFALFFFFSLDAV